MEYATIFTAVLRYLYRLASAITESTQFKEMEKKKVKYKFLWELLVILGAINFTLEYYLNEQVMTTHKQLDNIITNFIKQTVN